MEKFEVGQKVIIKESSCYRSPTYKEATIKDIATNGDIIINNTLKFPRGRSTGIEFTFLWELLEYNKDLLK